MKQINAPKTIMNNYVKIFVLVILIFAVYFHTFVWMIDRWLAKESYYSHGFLVPLVSIYLIWQRRSQLKSAVGSVSKRGLFLLAAGIFIHIISTALDVGFVSGFSLLITLNGLVLFVWGKDIYRHLWAALNFLIFMIPLPLVLIANISLKMKLFATAASVFLLNRIGIAAKQVGSTIYMLNSQLEVGDPCSGLRSLISLLALGVIFSYLSKLSRPQKFFLTAMSVPLAIISNIVRILFLAFVSDIYGPQYAHGFIHDAAGFMVFVISFVGLWGMERLLRGEQS